MLTIRSLPVYSDIQKMILIAVLFLPACEPIVPVSLPTITASPSALPSNTPSPSATVPPASTITSLPTETTTPSVTPSFTPTETATISYTYVFPIQPPELAGFAEGGHSYATDLFAPEGTTYVAVTSGLVDFVSYVDSWDPAIGDMAVAGGLCVAILGDDGVRYYGSHLSAIEPGITPGLRVAAGQVLGYVGHTGNARTTPPHVHFGISAPTYPEDWLARRGQVNPIPFLIAWRAGHNVTPPLPQP